MIKALRDASHNPITTVLLNLTKNAFSMIVVVTGLPGSGKSFFASRLATAIHADHISISSELFARLLSSFVDKLITIDPHLHRKSSLKEIYSVHCSVLHASPLISKWIKENINNPILIGPDSESEQWVSEVAANADAPFMILEKIRKGDRKVQVSVPEVEKYKDHTPVLVDDIISTAHTMIETVGHLKKAGMKPPVCIGIHPVMASRAYDKLIKAGAEKIVTCNSITHPSNEIKVDELLADEVRKNCFVVD